MGDLVTLNKSGDMGMKDSLVGRGKRQDEVNMLTCRVAFQVQKGFENLNGT